MTLLILVQHACRRKVFLQRKEGQKVLYCLKQNVALKNLFYSVDSLFDDTCFLIENCKYVSNCLSVMLLGICIKYMINDVTNAHSHCETRPIYLFND